MSDFRLRHSNHLMPTLFDRLCDDAPQQKRDHDISVSPVQLREIIRRDLSFLLNTVSHEDNIDAARYPQAAASVLNYGLPPLAGSFLYEHKWDDIRRAILRTIIRFEPRLKASTSRSRMSAARAVITHYSLKFAAKSSRSRTLQHFGYAACWIWNRATLHFFNTEGDRWIHGYWNTTTAN